MPNTVVLTEYWKNVVVVSGHHWVSCPEDREARQMSCPIELVGPLQTRRCRSFLRPLPIASAVLMLVVCTSSGLGSSSTTSNPSASRSFQAKPLAAADAAQSEGTSGGSGSYLHDVQSGGACAFSSRDALSNFGLPGLSDSGPRSVIARLTPHAAEQFESSFAEIGSVVGLPVAPAVEISTNIEHAKHLGLDRYIVIHLDRWDPSASRWPHNPGVFGRTVEQPRPPGAWMPITSLTGSDVVTMLLSVPFIEEAWVAEVGRTQSAIVSDPLLGEQWHLINNGSVEGATVGSDINFARVWAMLNTVSPMQVVVCVIDTGVSVGHPDMGGPRLPGVNLLPGVPDPANTDDDGFFQSHGTHMAGIIAASTNNAIGGAGICPTAVLLPIKAVDAFGFTNESLVASAITYARNAGSRVVNVSIGLASASSLLRATAEWAAYTNPDDPADLGMVMVASVGNTPSQSTRYPAALPEFIAVSATTPDDQAWALNSLGPATELSAPGTAILAPWNTPFAPYTYSAESGTSQATAIVSGVAAIVLSINPGINAEGVRSLLQMAALDRGTPGRNEQFGYGRIDAYVAGALALRTKYCIADWDRDGLVTVNDYFAFLTDFFNANADVTLDGLTTVEDYFVFISVFFEAFTNGC